MSAFPARVTPFFFGLLLLATSSLADAQVTLKLTTQGSNPPVVCTVTTDANGVSLAPDGSTLQATVTNYSGTCGSGTPPQPPQPFPTFLLTVPATATVGNSFPVNWSVTGASTCTGSASLVGGGSVTLPGWTDTTTTTSPRNVTASQAGTYTLGLACTNAAGTTNSTPATVVVSQGGGGACNDPAGLTRQTSGLVKYTNGGGQATRDFTSFAALFGHNTQSDPQISWPGLQGATPIPYLSRNQYFAAQFTVPANASPSMFGQILRGTYSYGINMTSAYSTTCGDFNPAMAACVSVDPSGAPAQPLVKWHVAPSSVICSLTPGATYYLNVKATNPAEVTDTCPGSATSCPMATSNSINY